MNPIGCSFEKLRSQETSLKVVFHSAKNSDQTNFSDRKFLPGFFSSFSIYRADYIQLENV